MLAIEEIKAEPWFSDCQVWLYRGAWQEFEPYEASDSKPHFSLKPLAVSNW